MKKFLYTIFFLILLISCARYKIIEKNIVSHNKVKIEKDFMPHVKKFEFRCKKSVDVSIRFASRLPGDIVGVCVGFLILPRDFRFILIDNKWWNEVYLTRYKESLIMHELGHCMLNKWHNNKEKDNIPTSFMNKSVFYPVDNIDYFDELCNK